MSGPSFLLAAMLCFSAAKALKVTAPVKILTSAGGTVTLPCRTDVRDADVPSVEWSKVQGRDPIIAFLYRDGCETFEEKNPTFRYRTNLIMNELKDGNISLRLSDVRRSDEGTYKCKVFRGAPPAVTTVELSVGAASEPKLSVVTAAGGAVTLQCEADCWSPKPEIIFLDVRGNVIVAEDQKSRHDSGRGCFIVTRRVTVHTADRVTCRVHQPDINETRVTEIDIPDDCVKSCTTAAITAAVVSVVVACGLCALTAFLRKKCCDFVGEQKSSTRINAEGPNQRNQDGIISELKLKLRDKEETIRRLTEELNVLRSKQSPGACQRGQPTIVNSPSNSSLNVPKPINQPPEQLPQNNDPKPEASTNSNRPKSGDLPPNKDSKPAGSHNHSSPALLTDNDAASPWSSPASPSQGAHVVRTKSMSFSRPRSNSAKLQRRYTTSGASNINNNPFSVLANLPEDALDDSEPLL